MKLKLQMPVFVAGIVAAFVFFVHESQPVDAAASEPVSAEAFGEIIKSAISAVNARGIAVTTEMKFGVEIQSPCRDHAITGNCFVVQITRDYTPPRTTHEVATVIGQQTAAGTKILNVYTFGGENGA